jgi:perosamine synthetase
MFENVSKIIDSKKLSGFTATPSGHSGGYWVQTLESAFCGYFGTKYAVAMNSATACLHSACLALIHPEDKVLVTPYSFSSSASCVLMVGGVPVFGDIDSDTFNLSPELLQSTYGVSFAATIPVHLFGHPADMDKFPNDKMFVIEDCAQAIGSTYKGKKVGTMGDCGIFSFNQAKQISTGEGGMLITNNEYLYRFCRAVRNHGEVSDPDFEILGLNYRMCEIEAYMALEQFKNLKFIIEEKEEKAYLLTKLLKYYKGITLPVVKEGCTHSWYRYAVKSEDKNILQINGFTRGYVEPLYKLPIYRRLGYDLNLPNVERINKEILIKAL